VNPPTAPIPTGCAFFLNRRRAATAIVPQVPSPGLPASVVALDLKRRARIEARELVFVRSTDAHATVRVSVGRSEHDGRQPGDRRRNIGSVRSIPIRESDIGQPRYRKPGHRNPTSSTRYRESGHRQSRTANRDSRTTTLQSRHFANPDIATPHANQDMRTDIANPGYRQSGTSPNPTSPTPISRTQPSRTQTWRTPPTSGTPPQT